MKKTRTQFPPACLVLAALALLLCACGGEPDYAQLPLENSQSGDVLTLGMDRASVDTLFANPEERSEGSVTFVDYHNESLGDITAWFQDDKAVYFSVGQHSFPASAPGETSPWSVKGISLGSGSQAVEDAFGIPTRDSGALTAGSTAPTQFQVMQYKYLADGTLLVTDTGDDAFSVSFLLQEGKVILFGIFSAGFDLYISNDATLEEASDQPLPISFPDGYGLTLPAGCTYTPLQRQEGLRILRDGQDICGLILLPFEGPQRLSEEGFTRKDLYTLLQPLLGGTESSSDYALSSSPYGSFMMKIVKDQKSSRHYFIPGRSHFYDLWVLDGALTPEEETAFLDSFYWEDP